MRSVRPVRSATASISSASSTVVGHGLLDRDVLARLEGGDHVVVVQVGRGQHLDGVEESSASMPPGRGSRSPPPFLGGLAAHLLVGVAHGDDVAAWVLEVPPHVHDRDVPGAQDPQPDPVHQTFPLPAFLPGPSRMPPSWAAAMRCRHNRAPTQDVLGVLADRRRLGRVRQILADEVQRGEELVRPHVVCGQERETVGELGVVEQGLGVLTGAIGVLTRPPKSSHSPPSSCGRCHAARAGVRGCPGRGRRTSTRASARRGPCDPPPRRSSSRRPAPRP